MSALRDQIRLRYTDGTVEVIDAGSLGSLFEPDEVHTIATALVGYGAGIEREFNHLSTRTGRLVAKVGLVMPHMPTSTKGKSQR